VLFHGHRAPSVLFFRSSALASGTVEPFSRFPDSVIPDNYLLNVWDIIDYRYARGMPIPGC
jgi:hypothetical protein